MFKSIQLIYLAQIHISKHFTDSQLNQLIKTDIKSVTSIPV